MIYTCIVVFLLVTCISYHDLLVYSNVYSITCVDPVYVTQTTIAVTILHKIHYSIQVPKTNTDYWFSKYNRVLLHYTVSITAVSVFAAAAATAAAAAAAAVVVVEVVVL